MEPVEDAGPAIREGLGALLAVLEEREEGGAAFAAFVLNGGQTLADGNRLATRGAS